VAARAISLVGLPGGGKSTIGRQLARRLGWDFADCDVEIERRIGCSIRTFFEREGERRFRELEADVIAELTALPEAVLATGGGAVLSAANREALHSRTHVVYLRSTVEELFRRLRHDTQRPLLQVSNPQAKLREMFDERDPLYREIAHFVVDTGRPPVGALVNMVLMQLELAGVIDPTLVPSPVEPPQST
jgi:shikimate kinase